MSDLFDNSSMLHNGYSQQVFRAVDKILSRSNFIDGIKTFTKTMPNLDETSYAMDFTLVKFLDNSDVSIPIIFEDCGNFFEVTMLIQVRDNYEITKVTVEMLEGLNNKLYENSLIKNYEKCLINPIYTSPMHVQISRRIQKTNILEDDIDMICDLCVEMFALPISFYRTAEMRVKAKTNSSSNTSSQNEGCYIATCVYGSYDCPQVWTLRRYRDNTLAKTWYGKTFICIYYAVSPTLVKWFGNTKWFKKMWKATLNKFVKNLQSKGVECTFYEDKKW